MFVYKNTLQTTEKGSINTDPTKNRLTFNDLFLEINAKGNIGTKLVGVITQHLT